MSSHGEWYPSTRHIFGIWAVWAFIILVVVLVVTGTFPVRKYNDDGELRHSVSSSPINRTSNDSGKDQFKQMGNDVLLPSTQITRSPRKPSHMAPRIGWPRQTVKPSIDLLQRTFSSSPTFTHDAPTGNGKPAPRNSSGVRTQNPVPSSTGIPGGSVEDSSDVSPTACPTEVILSSPITSPVPTDQDASPIPVESLTALPTVLVTGSSDPTPVPTES